MNDNNKLKHATLVLIITFIAIVYSLSAVICAIFVSGDFFNKSSLLSADNNTSHSYSDIQINSSNISTPNNSTENFNSSDNINSNIISEVESDVNNDSSSVNSSNTSSTNTTSSNTSNNNNSANSSSNNVTNNTSSNTSSGNTSSSTQITPPVINKTNFTNAVWFSFYELNFKGLSEAGFKNKIDTMLNNAVNIKCDAVIVHVRPFADAFYRSNLFPMSSYVTGTQGVDPGYDPLKYIVSAAHSRGLQIHAWINPYRIANSTDQSLLANTNKAKIWLNDENKKRNVLTFENKLYFNPTKAEVRELIIDGVREILDNYDVDGIHMDDYFYPTTDPNFDRIEYDEYVANSPNNKLSQGDWRRANVSALVAGIYSVVKQYNNVVFGISPAYSISKDKTDDNYNNQYADLAMWLKSDGFVDYMTPQLYFGYEHSLVRCRFNNLLDLWLSMPRNNKVKLYIGLAAYKIEEPTAADGDEWQTKTDILARQALESYTKGADGICIFSYSDIVSNNQLNKAQRENLLTALKTIKEDE